MSELSFGNKKLLNTFSWSLDGRSWTGQLKTCFLNLNLLSDFTPDPRPHPWHPKKEAKVKKLTLQEML